MANMKDHPTSCFNCIHLSSIKEGNKEYCCVTGYEIKMDEAFECDDFERDMKYPFDGDIQPAKHPEGGGCLIWGFLLIVLSLCAIGYIMWRLFVY